MKLLKATGVAIVKWVAIFAFGIGLILGMITIYDVVVGDGKIPSPRFVGIGTKEAKLMDKCSEEQITSLSMDEECWENLSDTFVLMDKVVPHVSEWMRSQKALGKVEFVSDRERWAYYDVLTGKVHISYGLLNRNNGFKCAILSHEWRHSRQNWGKWSRRLVGCALGRDDESIVENDAYMYQYLVEKQMLQPSFTNNK